LTWRIGFKWKRHWTFSLTELIFIIGCKCIIIVVFSNIDKYYLKKF